MASVPVPQPRPPLRRTRRPATRFLLAIAVALFLGLILASLLWLPDVIVRLDLDPKAPEPLTQADGLTAHNDVREVLLQGVGGLALLLGVAAGAWATLRQIQVSQEGQITERFTRAIEQLGSTEVDVRHPRTFSSAGCTPSSASRRTPPSSAARSSRCSAPMSATGTRGRPPPAPTTTAPTSPTCGCALPTCRRP